jgi:hypothetical protein
VQNEKTSTARTPRARRSLTMTWVPVRDERGRVRMETRWTAAAAAAPRAAA